MQCSMMRCDAMEWTKLKCGAIRCDEMRFALGVWYCCDLMMANICVKDHNKRFTH